MREKLYLKRSFSKSRTNSFIFSIFGLKGPPSNAIDKMITIIYDESVSTLSKLGKINLLHTCKSEKKLRNQVLLPSSQFPWHDREGWGSQSDVWLSLKISISMKHCFLQKPKIWSYRWNIFVIVTWSLLKCGWEVGGKSSIVLGLLLLCFEYLDEMYI